MASTRGSVLESKRPASVRIARRNARIKELSKKGYTQAEIAAKTRTHQPVVSIVLRNRTSHKPPRG